MIVSTKPGILFYMYMLYKNYLNISANNGNILTQRRFRRVLYLVLCGKKITRIIRLREPIRSGLKHVPGINTNNLNRLKINQNQPHLAEFFLYMVLCCTSCELTEGSQRRNCTFTSSIRRAPSRPGTVRTRKQSESGERCEILAN